MTFDILLNDWVMIIYWFELDDSCYSVPSPSILNCFPNRTNYFCLWVKHVYFPSVSLLIVNRLQPLKSRYVSLHKFLNEFGILFNFLQWRNLIGGVLINEQRSLLLFLNTKAFSDWRSQISSRDFVICAF